MNPTHGPPFSTVLVANRGEIAVRVIRTLRRLGIRAAAVYSDADAGARHVREADVAVRIGPAAAAASYLDIDAVLAAARTVGADAVHPGYGFLSERAAFARGCVQAGLVFIGPPAAAIETMGDKIRAKRAAQAAGVPVVPGRHDPGMTDDALIAAVVELGGPVLLKPAAGGGGKGMRRVGPADGESALRAAITAARREAAGAFGDDTLLVERYVEAPRHVELQVLADVHGGVVHLGERECSLQRRHQKIVEEAPSPLLDPGRRAVMGAAAVAVARACGYAGAGTVEFIVDGTRPDDWFFLEMNTRLQVEHPVTELVTGLDLVEEQLWVASGAPLRVRQEEVEPRGHAVEARIYAEDPAAGFLPTGGIVLALREPGGEGVRVDSGLAIGTVVGSDYDPMLAKVIAWAPDRATALLRLDRALAGTAVLGVVTNVAFLRRLLADPAVVAGDLDTELVERRLDALLTDHPGDGAGPPPDAVIAAALGRLAERDPGPGGDPFAAPSGWRIGAEPAWTHDRLRWGNAPATAVRVRGRAAAAQVGLGQGPPRWAAAELHGTDLTVTVDGVTGQWLYARAATTRWIGRGGGAWPLREVAQRTRENDAAPGSFGPLLAPMPGTVAQVHVTAGARVERGEPVVTVEAMKMEHVVRAATAGVVSTVLARVGQRVAMNAPLAVISPS